jgi:hypothetical protein
MGHDNLANHFKTNFGLMQHHKWSLSEMENMMPWERYIYIDLLQDYLREQEQQMKDREAEMKAQMGTANRRRL